MINLSETLIWKQKFGLLPIHLRPLLNDSTFVLLNGGSGDFCLQTNGADNTKLDYYSKSWSSNTKNYLVLDNELVKIFNWVKNEYEEIPQNVVVANFDKFYHYLLSNSRKSDKDVVPFIIDIFRQLRNLTQEKTNPVEALNLLFLLLSSLEDDYFTIDKSKWNLNDVNIPDNFGFFVDKINTGINSIKPELDLIIRHSAGILFQEAQKEVFFFSTQRDLFGGISNKLETVNLSYSSIHYTPPYVSRTIVENALRQLDLSKSKLKILDPSCGSSEFLVETLKQLRELNFSGNLEIIGWDSSETAINTSNFLLKYEQRTIWKDRLEFNFTIVEDSLMVSWDTDYDLILMNPPFVSWELLTSMSAKDAVQEALGNNFIGKPNQASAFFYKSVQSLNNGGVIGCVIPSSLLSLDSYKKLRDEVNELISFSLVGKLGNFVFEDALTDVSLLIGYKPRKVSMPTILWTQNEKGVVQEALRDLRKMYYSNELSVNTSSYSIFQPLKFPIIKDSWKPVSSEEHELLTSLDILVAEKRLSTVGEIFKVQQGIRQGVKNVFKITELEYLDLSTKEKTYFRLVADNETIKDGQFHYQKTFIWYPYDKDGMLLKDEKVLEKNAPFFFASKLEPNRTLLKKRSGISEWWGLTRPRNWQFEKQPKIISAEFGSSNSFAYDKTGRYVVERGNAWILNDFSNENDYYFYLSIFSSSFFDRLLSIYSKQLAGGNWYDLGKMYTNQIPLPKILKSEEFSEDLNKIHINSPIYSRLVEFGIQISEDIYFDKRRLDEWIQQYIYPVQ
ncbi:SAM-dependent DNA methyltransferase [Pedobacter frigidisoli]|uniref:site-specific DNA-methyltransferase (adenine-specific) n=1 Tax=Pedobacter frigidisoli TaxID=2530455 RepID=A0A4R0P9X9_9SPHI|nr:N-6 DNA methylase [Pedobacter frigidisoli]TCD11587.1 SAM-dependent DNA methyltransferase [Pedobacter frigidisoli]